MEKSNFFEFLASGVDSSETGHLREKAVQNNGGKEADGENSDGITAKDDSPSLLRLRNLYRLNKIDKDQYVGSLATLLATGLINKSQFMLLKAGA